MTSRGFHGGVVSLFFDFNFQLFQIFRDRDRDRREKEREREREQGRERQQGGGRLKQMDGLPMRGLKNYSSLRFLGY